MSGQANSGATTNNEWLLASIGQHSMPGLVLIYRKPDDAMLQLVQLGSHSELGL